MLRTFAGSITIFVVTLSSESHSDLLIACSFPKAFVFLVVHVFVLLVNWSISVTVFDVFVACTLR